MKKAIVFVISCATVVGGIWLAREVAFGQTAEKEEGITLTKSQFEKLVDNRVAQTLKGMEPVSDKRISQADNWHVVEFNRVRYTIYTGPGTVIDARPVQNTQPRGTAPRSGSAPSKPAAGTAPTR